jgi:hypothetical protein
MARAVVEIVEAADLSLKQGGVEVSLATGMAATPPAAGELVAGTMVAS